MGRRGSSPTLQAMEALPHLSCPVSPLLGLSHLKLGFCHLQLEVCWTKSVPISAASFEVSISAVAPLPTQKQTRASSVSPPISSLH